MKTIELKPRAIAVLVALAHGGPLTAAQLKLAIGPTRKSEPNGLLRAMSEQDPRTKLIARRLHDDRWYLTHDGLGWLQSHGMDAVPEARLWHEEEQASSGSIGAQIHVLAEQIRRDP